MVLLSVINQGRNVNVATTVKPTKKNSAAPVIYNFDTTEANWNMQLA